MSPILRTVPCISRTASRPVTIQYQAFTNYQPRSFSTAVRTAIQSSRARLISAQEIHPQHLMQPVLTEKAMPPVGPYSQAMKTSHAIYVSGQLPADANGNLVSGTMRDRTAACLQALSSILSKGGSGLHQIVKVQIFLTDMKDFAEMNEEYSKWIQHKPARSCVAVKELPKGVDIEIECIALANS